ncbi:2Fe-2S iron-sulfur cluster-binding protein [Chitiniphilus eburneus]|uniref:(2Fe-2S)-binding protein n=1 Tax=Chitiniphilus eburneus TaxID=2571148 RepID=A0A4U0PG86_9NEIS|nr:2Fe-2S iron-sulfur cluster-binding protein [Chitiniphilus eburneus]TJZ66835.1 (2Fe-2S)-binding protein [Chitiniphilus eburneus]
MPTLRFVNTGTQVEFTGSVALIEMEDHIMFGCKSGNCGTCAVRIVSGGENLSEKTDREHRLFELTGETDPAMRLACQCKAYGDAVLFEIN